MIYLRRSLGGKLNIDEAKKLQIESIVKRLKGAVTSVDIINWLGNFEEHEHDQALTILSKTDYLNERELIETLNERLRTIIDRISPESPIIIHPIGEYGKSGMLMVYYLKKLQPT